MASGASHIDPQKLEHLVRKLLALENDTTSDTSQLVALLVTKHREYERKDGAKLAMAVAAAVQNIRRKDVEPGYDADAARHDAERQQQSSGGGGGLNDMLRVRYRATTTAAATAATTPARNIETGPDDTTMMITDTMNGASTKRRGDKEDETKIATTAEDDNNNGASKPRKKLRRSKRSMAGSGSLGGSNSGVNGSAAATASYLMPLPRPSERYVDLGGMGDVIRQIRQLVEYPVLRPELYRHLGVDPPRGVLLRGPPGTGKTHLANAVAGELGVPFFKVSAPELVSGMSGESEERIRDLFQTASDAAPAIVFLDEIDAVAPKRSDASGSRGMEKRMVAQLLTSMDQLAPKNNANENVVLVLAATNRPDSLDPALRRAGRFDKEILMGVPDESARERILRTKTSGMRLSAEYFDYKLLARKTPGFVGADVNSLAKEAAVIAINRIRQDLQDDKDNDEATGNSKNADKIEKDISPLTSEQLSKLYITMDDFLAAIPLVQPSSKREGFATVPDVTWDDIGALHSIREELTMSVLEPIRAPEKFEALGLPLPAGVMLYGPPGCGKTLLAKAIAHESGANFISIKGPELLDKYVGESEKAVRLVFERARESSPCIVFFDELDSLVPKRGSDNGGGGGVSERVVNQLLTEMDGLESRRSVFVIAATNRPELIDPAMMRPGRLDRLLYVPLPSAGERVSILKALAAKVTLGKDVDLGAIGSSSRAQGYSGADCAALLREAGLSVMKEAAVATAAGKGSDSVALCVMSKHFDSAFLSVMPSVSKRDEARYERIRNRMARARSRGAEPITSVEIEEAKFDIAEGPSITASAPASETVENTDTPFATLQADKETVDAVAGSTNSDGALVAVSAQPEPHTDVDQLTNLEILVKKKKPRRKHENKKTKTGEDGKEDAERSFQTNLSSIPEKESP